MHPFKYCTNIEDLKHMLNNSDIPFLKYNKNNVAISNNCINLLKLLLNKNSTERISLVNILNHNWFTVKEEKHHHDFVIIDDHFTVRCNPLLSKIERSNPILIKTETISVPVPVPVPVSLVKQEDHIYPRSAPNTWHIRLVDSLWNIGSSTFGYISKLGNTKIFNNN